MVFQQPKREDKVESTRKNDERIMIESMGGRERNTKHDVVKTGPSCFTMTTYALRERVSEATDLMSDQ